MLMWSCSSRGMSLSKSAGKNSASPSASTITPNVFPFRLANLHHLDDPADDLLNLHDRARTVFARLGIDVVFDVGVAAVNVFDADHEARLAGDRRAVGEPAGLRPIVSVR